MGYKQGWSVKVQPVRRECLPVKRGNIMAPETSLMELRVCGRDSADSYGKSWTRSTKMARTSGFDKKKVDLPIQNMFVKKQITCMKNMHNYKHLKIINSLLMQKCTIALKRNYVSTAYKKQICLCKQHTFILKNILITNEEFGFHNEITRFLNIFENLVF